jgi:hypothetical protein
MKKICKSLCSRIRRVLLSPLDYCSALFDVFGVRFLFSLIVIQHLGKGFLLGWITTPAEYMFRDIQVSAARYVWFRRCDSFDLLLLLLLLLTLLLLSCFSSSF